MGPVVNGTYIRAGQRVSPEAVGVSWGNPQRLDCQVALGQGRRQAEPMNDEWGDMV